MSRDKSEHSRIAVKSDLHKLTEHGGVSSCYRARVTEVEALREMRDTLTPLDERLLQLDRNAACPACFPNETEKPDTALVGSAKLHWLAGKMHLTLRQVQQKLERIEWMLS